MSGRTWRIVEQCPVLGPGGELCSGEGAGHDPLGPEYGYAEHWCTDWLNGEMLAEPLTWSGTDITPAASDG